MDPRQRRRRLAPQQPQENELVKTLKVVCILMFLLFVLYMLSFSMNEKFDSATESNFKVSVELPEPAGEQPRRKSRSARGAAASGAAAGDTVEIESLNQASNLEAVLDPSETGVEDTQDRAAEAELARTPFSNSELPGVRGVRLVSGNLSNAFRAPGREQVETRLDLPRVFPRDVRVWKRTQRSKRTVCVFTRTPRQDSLFRTNIMSLFGSGDYNYVIMRSTGCQHDGTCGSPEMARAHPKCNPDLMPTVRLLERIKNFQHERFAQVLSNGMENYDVLVATGDEYCRATNTFNRAHFRMYHGPNVVNASLRTPVFLPLGPREEFERVSPREVRLVRERKYVFNFLGSLTSEARKVLIREIRLKLHDTKSFVHVIDKWSKKLTRQNGYVPPAEYKQVLLNSVFTLCPQGHNPEAFRIYEACEAGSIPIVVLDHHYRQHECKASYAPLIAQGAPFIFLNNWYELPTFLKRISKDPARLQRMQADVMGWYGAFMSKVAMQFETVMQLRLEDRLDKGTFTSSAHLAGLESYLEDPKYVKPLRSSTVPPAR